MLKKRLVLILLFLPALTFAQTAAELDALLETNTLTVSQAARFTLGAVGLTPPELSGATAVNAAYQQALSNGWVRSAQEDAITLQELAFLMMNAFELRGGIMYSIFRNPRYAYREMVYLRLMQGRVDANMRLSGQRFLQILGRTLNYTGEREAMDELLRESGGIN